MHACGEEEEEAKGGRVGAKSVYESPEPFLFVTDLSRHLRILYL